MEQDIVQKLNTYLESEGIADKDAQVSMSQAEILSALAATKDIQQYLTPYQGKSSGVFGSVKSKLTSIISHVVLGMLSEPLAKQQKFNDLVYKYLQQLADKK